MAGGRPSPPAVRLRSRSPVCRRAAPRSRHRGGRGWSRGGARGRDGHLRGHRPDLGQEPDDRHGRRVRRDADPPRVDRQSPRTRPSSTGSPSPPSVPPVRSRSLSRTSIWASASQPSRKGTLDPLQFLPAAPASPPPAPVSPEPVGQPVPSTPAASPVPTPPATPAGGVDTSPEPQAAGPGAAPSRAAAADEALTVVAGRPPRRASAATAAGDVRTRAPHEHRRVPYAARAGTRRSYALRLANGHSDPVDGPAGDAPAPTRERLRVSVQWRASAAPSARFTTRLSRSFARPHAQRPAPHVKRPGPGRTD